MNLRDNSQDSPASNGADSPGDSSMPWQEQPATVLFNPTYQDLIELAVRDCDEAQTKQKRWGIGKWFESTGLGPNDQVGDEFGNEFEAEISKMRNSLTQKNSPKYAGNIASIVRGCRALYVRELNHAGLPNSFRDLILFGLKKTGKSITSIKKHVSHTALNWAKGANGPKARSSPNLIRKLEDYLELPKGSLLARLPKAGSPGTLVDDLAKDIPYRRYVDIVSKLKYLVKLEDLHPDLQKAIGDFVVHKKQKRHLLSDGPVALEPTKTWNSESTVNIGTDRLRSFFGYLSLPKATKPLDQLTWEEKIQCGLGLPVKSLKFTMLVDKEYLFEYMQFCELRSFDKEHFLAEEERKTLGISGEVKAKTIPETFSIFLGMVNNLVNAKFSFLVLHREFAKEVDVPLEEWEMWLKDRHKEIRLLANVSKKGTGFQKRSSKEVCDTLLRREVPIDALTKMLAQMRKDVPIARQFKATHLRAIAIISFLLFDPLRSKNIRGLILEKHIRRDKEGRLVEEISKSEMKNFIHGHAEDRYRVLPRVVVEDINNWLEVRKTIRTSGTIEVLFCTIEDRSAIFNLRNFYRIVSDVTKRYLGLGIGPHAFRLLTGQTVGKHGTPQQVKALLNDSEAVAMDAYRDARNEDEFKALDHLYEQLSISKGGAK